MANYSPYGHPSTRGAATAATLPVRRASAPPTGKKPLLTGDTRQVIEDQRQQSCKGLELSQRHQLRERELLEHFTNIFARRHEDRTPHLPPPLSAADLNGPTWCSSAPLKQFVLGPLPTTDLGQWPEVYDPNPDQSAATTALSARCSAIEAFLVRVRVRHV